jgi:hypothetical protein
LRRLGEVGPGLQHKRGSGVLVKAEPKANTRTTPMHWPQFEPLRASETPLPRTRCMDPFEPLRARYGRPSHHFRVLIRAKIASHAASSTTGAGSGREAFFRPNSCINRPSNASSCVQSSCANSKSICRSSPSIATPTPSKRNAKASSFWHVFKPHKLCAVESKKSLAKTGTSDLDVPSGQENERLAVMHPAHGNHPYRCAQNTDYANNCRFSNRAMLSMHDFASLCCPYATAQHLVSRRKKGNA